MNVFTLQTNGAEKSLGESLLRNILSFALLHCFAMSFRYTISI
jgi:hypothetical protein